MKKYKITKSSIVMFILALVMFAGGSISGGIIFLAISVILILTVGKKQKMKDLEIERQKSLIERAEQFFLDDCNQDNINKIAKELRHDPETVNELWDNWKDTEIKRMADPDERYYEFGSNFGGNYIKWVEFKPDPNNILVFYGTSLIGKVPDKYVPTLLKHFNEIDDSYMSLYAGRYKRYDAKSNKVVIEESPYKVELYVHWKQMPEE